MFHSPTRWISGNYLPYDILLVDWLSPDMANTRHRCLLVASGDDHKVPAVAILLTTHWLIFQPAVVLYGHDRFNSNGPQQLKCYLNGAFTDMKSTTTKAAMTVFGRRYIFIPYFKRFIWYTTAVTKQTKFSGAGENRSPVEIVVLKSPERHKNAGLIQDPVDWLIYLSGWWTPTDTNHLQLLPRGCLEDINHR